MNRKICRRIIQIILVIAWCGIIFSFSSEDSVESSETSGGLIASICDFLIPEFDSFSGAERDELIESMQFFVRKSAHFTAYAILGFLSWFALFDVKTKLRYAFSVGFSFLYACSDEIHQHFVSGRSSEIRDVLIDTVGAILGALFALGITNLTLKIQKQHKNSEMR